MNPTTWTIYREYLDKTGNDAVAASLALADALQSTLDAKTPEATPQATTMLTVNEAAERLHLCSAKVYGMCRAGELPNVKVGRVIRIPMEEIERFEANVRPAETPRRIGGKEHL